MSRVSDAMRRAGHEDDGSVIVPDDTAFVAGEGGSGEPPGDPLPDDTAPAAIRGELVPRDAHLPVIGAARVDRPRGDTGEDIRLHDVLRLLWRRRWMIAGVVGACLSIGVTYARTATPIFEASARVLIEPSARQVVPIQSQGQDPGRYDYFVTQIDVIRSRSLARKTMERLSQLPGAEALPATQSGAVVGTLTVAPSRSDLGDSRVLTVSMRSPSPERAAQVVNAHAQTYVDENLENLRRGSREASEWLTQRLAELRTEVSSAQGSLQIYRERQNAVSLEEKQNIVVDRLGQLNASATEAKLQLYQKQAIHQQLVAFESANLPLDTLPAIQSNAFIQGIKGELEKLRQDRTKLSAQFLDTNPEMKDIDTAIANQQRRLAVETNKIAESIKNEYKTAQVNMQGLAAELEAQKSEVLDLNRKAIGYGELQRNATSIQQIFDMVMTRLKETELSGELPSNNIRILDPAEVPGVPVAPKTSLIIVFALLGGCVLAVGLVFALELLRPRLLDPQDVASALGLPLLGSAPRVSKFGSLVTDLDAVPGEFREAIRHIRAQIFLSAAASNVRTIAVTSARPGEGKTVMATSLAISIAMSGRRVLLVDGDLRAAQLARLFSIPRAPGLSNIVAGEVKPSDALVESPIKGLYVLPAGDERANPGDLLDSERLNQLMTGLRRVFDVVVFDCPPVMAVADAAIVASAATSVVFVVGAGLTSREVAQQAVERLEAVQARILGVVLNKAKTSETMENYYAPYADKKTAASA